VEQKELIKFNGHRGRDRESATETIPPLEEIMVFYGGETP